MPYAYKVLLMPKIRAGISNGLILNPGIQLWAKTGMLSEVYLKRCPETIPDKDANKCRNILHALRIFSASLCTYSCSCIWERSFTLKP